MDGTKRKLESRLDSFVKQATCEKLAKMRRYRMFMCSLGLSVIVFVAYSIVSPISVSEQSLYQMKDNQAVSLPELSIVPTVKTKSSKPSSTKETKTLELIPSEKSTLVIPTQKKAKTIEIAKKSPVVIQKSKKKPTPNTIPMEAYPVWSENETYQIGDRVIHNDKIYEANQDNSGSPPDEQNVIFGSSWDEVKE